ncbi:hypothetical protein K438DRAFT_1758097 [Mycena galopus ATCC 62051]|nr:hypothetical protein K438DRAFT_1758097 [Mycena galopus ATCC 62051]
MALQNLYQKDAKSTRSPPLVKWSEKGFHPMSAELLTADVAEGLFIKRKPDTKYTADDLSELVKVVKNRVTYPVMDHYAVAYNGTRVDLNILDRDGEVRLFGPIPSNTTSKSLLLLFR